MGSALPLMINLTMRSPSFGAGVVASWLRLSPVIGYLAAGIIVGPFTPGFVADRELIAALADVGVVLLIYLVKTELKFCGWIKGLISRCLLRDGQD